MFLQYVERDSIDSDQPNRTPGTLDFGDEPLRRLNEPRDWPRDLSGLRLALDVLEVRPCFQLPLEVRDPGGIAVHPYVMRNSMDPRGSIAIEWW